MIEWTDEDVQAAITALYKASGADLDATDDEMRAALDAALASALRREAASVPQDEVDAFNGALRTPYMDDQIAAGIAALDAHRAKPVVDGLHYVQSVPDHCDRITWRNRYYHLKADGLYPVAAPQPDSREQALNDMADNARELGLDYIAPKPGDDHE